MPIVMLVLVAGSACAAAGRADAPRMSGASSGPVSVPTPRPAEERLMVFGDVQLAAPFKADPTLAAWRSGELDTSELTARFTEALRESRPHAILQTGDLVDLNESAVLELPARATRLRQGWSEWAPTLAALPGAVKIYPVVGNHERYGELLLTGDLAADGEHVELRGMKLTRRMSPREVHEATLTRFPHLRSDAEFHGETGSYYFTFGRYCLLSIDGADLDDDPSLFAFIDAKLKRCANARKTAVVSDHYPLFTGRPRSEDDSLELARHRERLLDTFSRHRVALVFTGHEHFYLRYLEGGLARAGFRAPSTERPVYVTVSDFANPYSRRLERIADVTPTEARYFEGTHYATVTFRHDAVRVVAKGFDARSRAWRDIDAFTVPP